MGEGRDEGGGAGDPCLARTERRAVAGPPLATALVRDLNRLGWSASDAASGLVVTALFRAAELECALADARAPDAGRAAWVTDLLGRAVVTGVRPDGRALAEALGLLEALAPPATLAIDPAATFACQGLHPLDWAERAERATLVGCDRALVVGAGLAGYLLGAVVMAALGRRGIEAQRLCLRPGGEDVPDPLLATDRDRLFVVDGPSTSAAALASALIARGADGRGIEMMAADGRSVAAEAARRAPMEATTWVGAGAWRHLFYPDRSAWPAAWTGREAAKFLSADGRSLFKFEGLGRRGLEAQARARILAEGGFLPRPSVEEAGDGYVRYGIIDGRPLAAADLDREILDRLADYCAFRVVAFPERHADTAGLARMARANGLVELGWAPELPLEAPRPVIPDGQLRPHEWIRARWGSLYKVDATSHGDEDLLPGPTDIAWDLAGVVLEWDLDGAAREHLLARYRRQSGDDARPRVAAYLTAYALFRCGYWRMAAHEGADRDEAPRARAEHARCRARLSSLLLESGQAPVPLPEASGTEPACSARQPTASPGRGPLWTRGSAL